MDGKLSNNEFFKFEDKNYDYPFYNKNPQISIKTWILIFLGLLFGFMIVPTVISVLTKFDETSAITLIISPLLSIIIIGLPLYYACNKNLSLIMHKITRNELILSVILFIAYIIYGAITVFIFQAVGITPNANPITSQPTTLTLVISFILSVLLEELIKIIPFLFLLTMIYKISKNRKLSIIVSSLVIMIYFGLLHVPTYNNIAQALIIIGIGTVFELIGYIKTKNMLVPYLTHLMTDLFAVLVMFLSFL